MNYGCGTQPVLTCEFCQEKKTHQQANFPENNNQTSKIIRFRKASGFVCKPWVFEQNLEKLWFWICKVYIHIYIYISLSLSLSLSICLFVYLSICLSICLCLYPSISLFVLVSNYLSMCPCIYLSLSPSISLAVPVTIYLSVCLSIYLFIYLSVCPSIYVSIYVYTFSTSQLPKVVRTPSAFNILTSKRASRHNGVHFFDIWTSKSGPSMVCFVHFDLEMCFAPQRRALFRHLTFQKWSDNGVFCTFWLGNVLRATTFSISHLPNVVRAWCVLYILTWKCASCHNGVHFFDMSTSKSGPELVCFVHFDFQMRFAPQRRALFHLSSGQLAPHPPL